MRPAPPRIARVAAPQRHYLLYARQTLRDFRAILVIFTVVYLGIGGYQLVTTHSIAQALQWAISGTFPLIIAFMLYLYSRQT